MKDLTTLTTDLIVIAAKLYAVDAPKRALRMLGRIVKRIKESRQKSPYGFRFFEHAKTRRMNAYKNNGPVQGVVGKVGMPTGRTNSGYKAMQTYLQVAKRVYAHTQRNYKPSYVRNVNLTPAEAALELADWAINWKDESLVEKAVAALEQHFPLEVLAYRMNPNWTPPPPLKPRVMIMTDWELGSTWEHQAKSRL